MAPAVALSARGLPRRSPARFRRPAQSRPRRDTASEAQASPPLRGCSGARSARGGPRFEEGAPDIVAAAAAVLTDVATPGTTALRDAIARAVEACEAAWRYRLPDVAAEDGKQEPLAASWPFSLPHAATGAAGAASDPEPERELHGLLERARTQMADPAQRDRVLPCLRRAEFALRRWRGSGPWRGGGATQGTLARYHLAQVVLLTYFALYHHCLGEVDEAVDYLRQVLALEQRVLDAAALMRPGSAAAATAPERLVWVTACRLLGEARANLCVIYVELGQVPEALRHGICAVDFVTCALGGPDAGSVAGAGVRPGWEAAGGVESLARATLEMIFEALVGALRALGSASEFNGQASQALGAYGAAAAIVGHLAEKHPLRDGLRDIIIELAEDVVEDADDGADLDDVLELNLDHVLQVLRAGPPLTPQLPKEMPTRPVEGSEELSTARLAVEATNLAAEKALQCVLGEHVGSDRSGQGADGTSHEASVVGEARVGVETEAVSSAALIHAFERRCVLRHGSLDKALTIMDISSDQCVSAEEFARMLSRWDLGATEIAGIWDAFDRHRDGWVDIPTVRCLCQLAQIAANGGEVGAGRRPRRRQRRAVAHQGGSTAPTPRIISRRSSAAPTPRACSSRGPGASLVNLPTDVLLDEDPESLRTLKSTAYHARRVESDVYRGREQEKRELLMNHTSSGQQATQWGQQVQERALTGRALRPWSAGAKQRSVQAHSANTAGAVDKLKEVVTFAQQHLKADDTRSRLLSPATLSMLRKHRIRTAELKSSMSDSTGRHSCGREMTATEMTKATGGLPQDVMEPPSRPKESTGSTQDTAELQSNVKVSMGSTGCTGDTADVAGVFPETLTRASTEGKRSQLCAKQVDKAGPSTGEDQYAVPGSTPRLPEVDAEIVQGLSAALRRSTQDLAKPWYVPEEMDSTSAFQPAAAPPAAAPTELSASSAAPPVPALEHAEQATSMSPGPGAGQTWQLIVKQDVRKALFSASTKTTLLENMTDPDSGAYMVVGDVDPSDPELLSNGRYHFRLVYSGGHGSGCSWEESVTLEWRQSSWLTEVCPNDFEGLSPDNISSGLAGSRFVGLSRSSASTAVFDGVASAHGNWWNCVGAIARHGDAIPAFQERLAQTTELYVLRRALTSWCYKPFNGLEMDVREGPDVDGPRADYALLPGDPFRVSEELPGPDGITFLRLADGRGWVFDKKPSGGTLCVRLDERHGGGSAERAWPAPSSGSATWAAGSPPPSPVPVLRSPEQQRALVPSPEESSVDVAAELRAHLQEARQRYGSSHKKLAASLAAARMAGVKTPVVDPVGEAKLTPAKQAAAAAAVGTGASGAAALRRARRSTSDSSLTRRVGRGNGARLATVGSTAAPTASTPLLTRGASAGRR
mmetsp:Transcript_85929/g.191233  ORF Transcript_85929/g.191233 Transcript_85929/m.191233 type:complete len:1391 (-) Transcript_85929:98-4270(-)